MDNRDERNNDHNECNKTTGLSITRYEVKEANHMAILKILGDRTTTPNKFV